jgi:nitrite reductase (NADH) large subunit
MKPHVIIGNGAAAISALESFRKYDSDSPVCLISKDRYPAYSRVLLPYYLRDIVSYRKVFIRDDDYYRRMNVETHFGDPAVELDTGKNNVILKSGQKITYKNLLIATGAHAVKPPIKGLEGAGVFHLWTLEDAQQIEGYLKPEHKALILGSGFVALQAAWAAVEAGLEVHIYELMDRIMPKVIDTKGSHFFESIIKRKGAQVHINVQTERVEHLENGKLKVFARDKDPLEVDFIIVGTGVRPNTEFLHNNSLADRNGVSVNSSMETSESGVYAAGDVALSPSTFGEPHVSHALWPTAVEHGKIAGANMAGKNLIYRGSLNMNVTGMFGVSVASMGNFQDNEEYKTQVIIRKKENRYLKVQLKDSTPQGGIVIGNEQDVKILGALRPLIRRKIKIENSSNLIHGLLEGRYYPQSMSRR